MPYYLSKILPLMVMPLSISLFAAVLAIIFVLRSNRLPALACLAASILTLWLFSLPVLAWQLIWSLQRQYPPIALQEVPHSDCLVVLGGALGIDAYPRAEPEFGEAIDRVYQAAKLFRQGKARIIIVAAGNQPWSRQLVTEAQQIRDLLVEWGVSETAIILDQSSKNTRENALNAADLIHAQACQTNILVTSAWHMPRAQAAFEKLGVSVFPVSVDVRLMPGSGEPNSRFLPNADALSLSSQAIREWLGIWVYRWRDWN